MLERFLNLISNYPDISKEIHLTDTSDDVNVETLSISNCANKDYHFLKHIARTYHQAKIALFATFEESNLKTWVPAPIDVDLFPIFPQPLSLPSTQQEPEPSTEVNNDIVADNNNDNQSES